MVLDNQAFSSASKWLLTDSTHLRKSNWELLKARAQENDTNVSAELRRILREEAEREAAKKSKAA